MTQLDRNALQRVDSAIAAVVLPDEPGLSAFIEALCAGLGIASSEQCLESVQAANLSRDERRFVGICLLRVLSLRNEVFDDKATRNAAFQIFDEVLSPEYKSIDITARLQTHTKRAALRDVYPKVERHLDDTIASLKDMKDVKEIDRFQGRLLTELKRADGRVKALIVPFLDGSLIQELDSVFDLVRRAMQTIGAEQFRAAEAARARLIDYRRAAEKFGTAYSIRFLSRVAERIQDSLERYFSSSPMCQPSSLRITQSEKKYPYHTKGNEVVIRFGVRNDGPGPALNVRMTVRKSRHIQIQQEEIYLGTLEVGARKVEVRGVVVEPTDTSFLGVELSWVNWGGEEQHLSDRLGTHGQRREIPWDILRRREPYQLEPIAHEEGLVGRTDVIDTLMALVLGRSVGSSYIYGQKRVGKTSIAKTLESLLEKQDGYIVVYLESGDYIHADATRTVELLGRKLADEVVRSRKSFGELRVPVFDGALSPLGDLLQSVSRVDPTCRIVFILDEFDELPLDLYKRGPRGGRSIIDHPEH